LIKFQLLDQWKFITLQQIWCFSYFNAWIITFSLSR